MIGTSRAILRLRGSGEHLRMRVAKAPDPLANVHECCRASVAVEKALGEAIRDALASGHNWAEVGQVLASESAHRSSALHRRGTPGRLPALHSWPSNRARRQLSTRHRSLTVVFGRGFRA